LISRNKFRAEKVVIDGITFDSKSEARRYQELLILKSAGIVRDLKVHPKFDLTIMGTKIGSFKPDFQYVSQSGAVVIEDVKGTITEAASLRIRVFQAIYRIPVTIIGKNAAKVRSFKVRIA